MGRMGRGNGDFGFWLLDWGGGWGNRTNGTDAGGRNGRVRRFPLMHLFIPDPFTKGTKQTRRARMRRTE